MMDITSNIIKIMLAGAEGPADIEELADAEDLAGAEGPADVEEAVVICYKHQY